MANVKISNLTAATTPVAGTEVLPIVQSGATVKVSIANLTPGLDTITAAKGGTGQTSYAVGDLLYASTTTALSKLADVATGNALISGGVSTAPSWGKIGLTTHVSGVLPTANGGTNLSSFTANGVVYASSTSALTTGSALVFDGTNFQAAGALRSAATTAQVQLISGSNVAGTTSFDLIQSGNDAYVYNRANGPLLFGVNNSEKMRLDSAGNLGLGVTPSAWGSRKALEVGNAGSALFSVGANQNYLTSNSYFDGAFKYGATGTATAYQQYAGTHAWLNAVSGSAGGVITFTQAMTLDASGGLRVGTTSSLSVADKLTVVGGNFAVQRTSGITTFMGDNTADGYAGTATNHAFALLTNSTERARIDTSGNLLVNVTSTLGGKLSVSTSTAAWAGWFQQTQGAGSSNLLVEYSAAAPNNTTDYFGLFRDNAAQRIQLRSNGGLANYSANNVNLSDRREKTNFAPAGSYLDKICAIPVQTFNYIDQNMEDDGGLTLGVVAQDVQAVAPELVMESNWAKEGEEPKMRLSIYQTDLQYALMKCIQEQQAIIQSLTARITALESA